MQRIAAIFVVLVLSTALWWGGARYVLPPPEDARATAVVMSVKEAIAAENTGPNRLFIVGGSSSRYGYSASELTRLTGFSATNLGAHAALGTDYILDRAKATLHTDDTVLLALEPHLLIAGSTTAVTSRVVQFDTPEYMLVAPLHDWPSLLLGVNPHDLLRSWFLVQIAGETPLDIGEAGDETRELASDVTDFLRRSVENTRIPPAVPITDKNLAHAVRGFVEWSHAKGIKVLLAWPTMLNRDVYATKEYTDTYSTIIDTFKRMGVTTLGVQTDFLLPADMMYDTAYHPNDIGREKATRVLAARLCEAVTCPHQAF